MLLGFSFSQYFLLFFLFVSLAAEGDGSVIMEQGTHEELMAKQVNKAQTTLPYLCV